jgi:hypothetical protein
MIFNTASLFLSAVLFASCCTSSNVSKKSNGIPETIRRSSDNFIVSKTGEKFFNQYVEPDYDKITKVENGYLMVYNFSIPENEGVEGEIRFLIDSLGNVQRNKEITGIPECSSEPCDFTISKDEAENIAKKAGLESGVKDWDINFVWDNNYDKYFWQIRTVLNESKREDDSRSSGKVVLIDPNTGEVIKTEEWRIN